MQIGVVIGTVWATRKDEHCPAKVARCEAD